MIPAREKRVLLPDARIETFGDSDTVWSVPPLDLARQAIGALRGYVYQLHQTAAAWIRLGDDDILFLEVAEDYAEIVRNADGRASGLRATQLKDIAASGAVTLNSPAILETIANFFALQACNPGREVRLAFLTTAQIGSERINPLPSGTAGLVAWQAAAEGGDVAEIRAALCERLPEGAAKSFVADTTEADLRARLLRALTFACGAPAWPAVAAANRAELVKLRHEVRATANMADRAYDSVIVRVVQTILTSSTRALDRRDLIDTLALATSIALPSQMVADLLPSTANGTESATLTTGELREISQALLEMARPPSLIPLFPDATNTDRKALMAAMAVERVVLETDRKPPQRLSLNALHAQPALHHLLVGQPGSGKSHALWHYANRMLTAGEILPIFLSAAQLERWSDVERILSGCLRGASPATVYTHPKVCVFIDGWSEFANGQHLAERRLALSALARTRVIANGQRIDPGDQSFRPWSLELLAPADVAAILADARPGLLAPTASTIDLLRLPLLLSIHLLSGSDGSQIGELLRQFHDHLAHGLPATFTEALADAVATLAQAGDRSWGRFKHALLKQAQARGVAEPLQCLRQLGTISERSGQAMPVHDLYWAWLGGLGLLACGQVAEPGDCLHAGHGLALALQSGAQARDADITAATAIDLPLAAMLDASRQRSLPAATFRAALDDALRDRRLAVRNRAALAALATGRPEYLAQALGVLSEISAAQLPVPEWQNEFRPAVLFTQRAILAEWIGSDGTTLVLEVIAARGSEDWVPWLEHMVSAGKLSGAAALAAALGCSGEVPEWGTAYCDALMLDTPWELAETASRRSNRALAMLIAANYERWIGSPGGSGWLNLNRVLIECGDEAVFNLLLARFGTMPSAAQRLLGYAIVALGEPWIARFQRIAFAQPGDQGSRLAEVVSTEIDDATARAWIVAGHEKQGWRVLIARHGAKIVPELVAQLPQSFNGLATVPALEYLTFLRSGPKFLVDEIWSRISGTISPKVMQDVLDALTTIVPEGVASIIGFVTRQPLALSAYHVMQVTKLWEDWREKLGEEVLLQFDTRQPQPLPRWLARLHALRRWDDFSAAMLSALPDLAIDLALGALRNLPEKADAILAKLADVGSYSAPLVDKMLATPGLAARIPTAFSGCFDTFPAEALRRCIDAPDIDQDALLFRLSATSQPLHKSVHAELLRRALCELPNLHRYRAIASMLRAHSRHEVVALIQELSGAGGDDWIWLVRAIEQARDERLLAEGGSLLPL